MERAFFTATILLVLPRSGLADLEYGLCSEVYQMHQYCTKGQFPPQSDPGSDIRLPEGRVGKAGPPGKPGIVNYTIIEENIGKKLEDLKSEMDHRFTAYQKHINEIVRDNTDESIKPKVFPANCSAVLLENAKIRNSFGGVFDIYPETKQRGVEVYCDVKTDGGGWTVFQRRMDGSVDFYRGWDDYVRGFGEKDKEMWLGLETIHQLTKGGNFELRVEMLDWQGNAANANYGTFSIAGSSDNYRLRVGQFSGTAGDSLITFHSGMQFSTFDRDFDTSARNCAQQKQGAWWYKDCLTSSLNGLYYRHGPYVGMNDGIQWSSWKDDYLYSLKFSEMKFRRKD